MRHGETDFNRQNIVQGSGVDTDLNDLGREQSDKFYEAYHHQPFDRVYTSALKRASQSVRRFIDSGIPHTVLPQLNEICWGEFEGKEQTNAQRNLYWELIHKWQAGDLGAKIPEGESPLEMQERQRIAAHHILANEQEKNVLICMHGRAMKSFLCLLLNEPLTKMEDFQHTNLCLYVLEYEGGKASLLERNNTEHLFHR